MSAALLAVGAAAVCSGTATVLQAWAVRRIPGGDVVGISMFRRLLRDRVYLTALALVGLGFVSSFWALQQLPLFVVQAGRASSLGVSAVLGTLLLGARLGWRDVGALGGVAAGIVILAVTVAPGPSRPAPVGIGVALAVGLVVVVLAAAGAARLRPLDRSGFSCAFLSGLAFAGLAVGARTLRSLAAPDLARDPTAWMMAAAGVVGLGLAVIALDRAPVVPATALMVATETVVAAALGVVLAGDRAAPGSAATAGVGFVLVLVGALALARFGVPDRVPPSGHAARQGPTAGRTGTPGPTVS